MPTKAALPALKAANASLVESRVNLFYYRDVNVREKAILFEKKLNEKYNPATIYPIGDGLDAELARFSLGSKNGFSTITVSQIAIQHVTQYSGDWQQNHAQCFAYIKERAEMVFPIAAEVLKTQIKYVGITIRLQFLKDFKKKDEATNYLINRFYHQGLHDSNVEELNSRIAFRSGDNHFVNLSFQNVTNFTVPAGLAPQALFSPKQLEQGSVGLELSIDVNDRQAFNNDPNHATGIAELGTLLAKAKAVYGQVDELLATGVIKP